VKLLSVDDEEAEAQPCRSDWPKVTAQKQEAYYHEILLDQLQLPMEAIHCYSFNWWKTSARYRDLELRAD